MVNKFDLVTGGDVIIAKPVSDFGAAENLGVFASMRNVKQLNVLVQLAAGTGVEHVTLELEQATSMAGAGAKPLNISRLHYKVGANLAVVNSWTLAPGIDRETPVASWLSSLAGAATLQLAAIIRIDEDDLDTNNGFSCVRFKMADAGTARNGVCLYIATEMGYQGLSKPSLAV